MDVVYVFTSIFNYNVPTDRISADGIHDTFILRQRGKKSTNHGREKTGAPGSGKLLNFGITVLETTYVVLQT